MAEIRENWLKLTTEEAIDPDLPICDPHHHLWYQSEHSYTLENFLQDISGGHRITKTVFVESRMMLRNQGPEEMKPVGETEYIQNLVSRSPQRRKTEVAAGIVGFADLTLGQAVAPVLEAHIAAGKGRFRGIRQTVAKDIYGEIKSRLFVPSGLMSNAKFREGLACLRKYGLSFDAWLFHPQLMEMRELAITFPDIHIVLDHLGGPLGSGHYAGKREAVFQDWQRGITELADCPNIFIKLGGLGMEIGGFNWYDMASPPGSIDLANAYQPYFLHCVEKLGTSRCMFESNFPVDKRSYSYTIIWNAFKRITKDFSKSERQDLFYNTACRFYRI